jgi:hypothetical protein
VAAIAFVLGACQTGDSASAPATAASKSDKAVDSPESLEEVVDPNSKPAEPEPFPAVVDELRRDGTVADDPAPDSATEGVGVPSTPGSSRSSGVGRGELDVPREARERKSKKKSPSKQAPPATAKPSSRPKGGAGDASEPFPQGEKALADPESMLASLTSLEADLRSAGVRLPQDTRGREDEEDQTSKLDCSKVCELQAAICSLEERICSMAEAHPEDDRYANACERASGDCKVARRACRSCG